MIRASWRGSLLGAVVLGALATVSVGTGGCVGDVAAPPAPASGDAGGPGTTDAGSVVPVHAATGLAFPADENLACSLLTGDVTISRAVDESDVTDYVLYWGSSATAKLGAAITVHAKTGADVVYALASAVRPATATHLLAFTKNAAGEMATGVAATISEVGQTIVQDVSAGQGANSANTPSVAIDAVNGKLLIVTSAASTNKPVLVRCNLDGTSCALADISAGQGNGSGTSPVVLVDKAANKVLVVTTNVANSSKPSLFRCDLDGTTCTHTDISASQGVNSGLTPSAVIDTVNSKLLTVTRNGADNAPGLFRCNLDGTSCTYVDISAAQGGNSGITPSAAIDSANGKLLVATNNVANSAKPGFFRCNLDGTSCTYSDISGLQAANTGTAPRLVIDAANAKVLVVTSNDANGARPALFRCNLDGTACGYFDISAGQAANNGTGPAAAIDPVNGKLLVAATVNDGGDLRAGFFRCNLDGTGCSFKNISPGVSQFNPAVVWNAANQSLLTVVDDAANQRKARLLSVCGH